MSLMVALQNLAVRLGLDPSLHLTPDGKPRTLFLAVACLASLALWACLGWGFGQLIACLAAR